MNTQQPTPSGMAIRHAAATRRAVAQVTILGLVVVALGVIAGVLIR